MCTSLEFNELFGSSFDVPCFVFSSFVVQFSRYRLLPLFATAYLVYHTQFRLSRGFLNFFQVSFRHFRPLKVTIPCSFSRSPCLPCLSGTGSLAELYYITTFFSFCQPLFYLFFAFFSSFLPFLFDVSSFLSLFHRFFGVLWVFVGRDGCGAMIRGLLTSELFWKKKARAKCCPDRGKLPAYQEVPERETFLRSFCFCKKNQKAAGTPSCDLGSNRRSNRCLGFNARLSSGNRLCTNHYFAQYRQQWFEPLRTPSVAKLDVRLCTNSKRILLLTVGYDGHRMGSYGVVGKGCFFR